MLEKARGGLANALADRIENARVLDLYAGSGALGLEMLSRGAQRAAFVERDPAAVRVLKENIARCGFADRALVMDRPAADAVGALSRAGWRLKRPRADAPPVSSVSSPPSVPSATSTSPSAGRGGVEPVRFDLVFADPPFEQAARWENDSEGRRLMEALPALLAPGGIVLFRLEGRRAPAPSWPGLTLSRDQHYGRSRILWFAAAISG